MLEKILLAFPKMLTAIVDFEQLLDLIRSQQHQSLLAGLALLRILHLSLVFRTFGNILNITKKILLERKEA